MRLGRLGDAAKSTEGFDTSAGAQWQGKPQDGQPKSRAPVCLRRSNASEGPASPPWGQCQEGELKAPRICVI